LRQNAAEQKSDLVAREAHALKGAARTMGFLHLAEMARRLEMEARAGRHPNVDRAIASVSDAIDQVLATLAEKGLAA